MFDFIIGNPPYQQDTAGENTFAAPCYHDFMSAAHALGGVVSLVTPARFLFNAGATPKAWNKKMLSDTHLKVLEYHQDSGDVFPNTEIRGGVCITYRDKETEHAPIGVFVPFPELKSMLEKVWSIDTTSLTSIINTQSKYNLEAVYLDHPECRDIIGSDGQDKRLRNNAFEKLGRLFSEQPPADGAEYAQVYGLEDRQRVTRYIRRDYLQESTNFSKWEVLVPRAWFDGPIAVCPPGAGYTQTFIGVGAFDHQEEAAACMRYVKTRFARCLLKVLKVTQDNPPETWAYVPMQDFTSRGGIDWSVSISEIDQQLYTRYGLTAGEVAYIEQTVKVME